MLRGIGIGPIIPPEECQDFRRRVIFDQGRQQSSDKNVWCMGIGCCLNYISESLQKWLFMCKHSTRQQYHLQQFTWFCSYTVWRVEVWPSMRWVVIFLCTAGTTWYLHVQLQVL